MAENGLHMRPAAKLVSDARSFECDIVLEVQGKQANSKSLFKLQALELSKGSEVTVICKGQEQECQRALDCLTKFLVELK